MTRSPFPFSSLNWLQSQTTTGFRVSIALKMPEEHGSWEILPVPFFCAAAVAGRWNPPLLLSGACALSLFLLRSSLEARNSLLRRRALFAPTHLLLAAVGIATGARLVFFYRRYELAWLGLAAAVPGGFHPHPHVASAQITVKPLRFPVAVREPPLAAFSRLGVHKCDLLKARVIIYSNNQHRSAPSSRALVD